MACGQTVEEKKCLHNLMLNIHEAREEMMEEKESVTDGETSQKRLTHVEQWILSSSTLHFQAVQPQNQLQNVNAIFIYFPVPKYSQCE